MNIIFGEHYQESKICNSIRDKNLVTFTRSANDSTLEINFFLKLTDEFISKTAYSTDKLLGIIAKVWLNKLGIPLCNSIRKDFDENYISFYRRITRIFK